MKIELIATPAGFVPQLREKGKTIWEGIEQPTPETARTAAVEWLNSEDNG